MLPAAPEGSLLPWAHSVMGRNPLRAPVHIRSRQMNSAMPDLLMPDAELGRALASHLGNPQCRRDAGAWTRVRGRDLMVAWKRRVGAK